MKVSLWDGQAKFHITVFALSIFLMFYSSLKDFVYVNMVLMEVIVLYIAITHRTRRELLPALFILVTCKLIALPVFISYYSSKTVHTYTEFIILYNLVVMFCLVKFYRSNRLRVFLGVVTPSRKIPQVFALVWVFGLSTVQHLMVLAEVLIYKFDPTFFVGVPFFYGNYDPIALTLKLLLLLAVWSMCLDSYFVDYERYRKSAKNLRRPGENDMPV